MWKQVVSLMQAVRNSIKEEIYGNTYNLSHNSEGHTLKWLIAAAEQAKSSNCIKRRNFAVFNVLPGVQASETWWEGICFFKGHVHILVMILVDATCASEMEETQLLSNYVFKEWNK